MVEDLDTIFIFNSTVPWGCIINVKLDLSFCQQLLSLVYCVLDVIIRLFRYQNNV